MMCLLFTLWMTLLQTSKVSYLSICRLLCLFSLLRYCLCIFFQYIVYNIVIKGNGLNIMKTRGEGVVGFDRIYIGAAVDRDDLENITKLLTPGGILVGPVDDDLVKVTRVGVVSKDLEDDTENEDSSLAGLNEEFTSQILSGVRFAPLTTSSAVTVIPANVWNPSSHVSAEFKQASMQLLMCASSQLVQPLPRVPTEVERTNVASMLPKTLWLEVLSYTHRNCKHIAICCVCIEIDCNLPLLHFTLSFILGFKPEQNETDYLKRRLREEKLKNANLERARREAEERCAAAERERSVYKMLARRWQSRLDTLLNEHEEQGNNNDAGQDLLDLADGIRDDETAIVNNRNRSALSNLRDILQNINSDDEEDNMEELGDDDDDMNMDLEEDDENVEGEVDEDDFASAVEEEEDVNEEDVDDDSVVMEDVDTSMEESRAKPRTVSVSSDDL